MCNASQSASHPIPRTRCWRSVDKMIARHVCRTDREALGTGRRAVMKEDAETSGTHLGLARNVASVRHYIIAGCDRRFEEGSWLLAVRILRVECSANFCCSLGSDSSLVLRAALQLQLGASSARQEPRGIIDRRGTWLRSAHEPRSVLWQRWPSPMAHSAFANCTHKYFVGHKDAVWPSDATVVVASGLEAVALAASNFGARLAYRLETDTLSRNATVSSRRARLP